jgi:hypothetical protein
VQIVGLAWLEAGGVKKGMKKTVDHLKSPEQKDGNEERLDVPPGLGLIPPLIP